MQFSVITVDDFADLNFRLRQTKTGLLFHVWWLPDLLSEMIITNEMTYQESESRSDLADPDSLVFTFLLQRQTHLTNKRSEHSHMTPL